MISKYEIFRQSIKNYIQNSEFDIGVVYYVFKDLFRDIENTYYATLNKEAVAQAQVQKEHPEPEKEEVENEG